jgi:pimeloyl-ACP methyl ester carboxylesterase
VLVPDLPGFGLSLGRSRVLDVRELASALAEWMRLARAAPAHLVGNSFGSQIAAELAARFPQQVRSLTLVGPTVDPEARGLYRQAGRLFAELRLEPIELGGLWAGRASRYARGSGLRQAAGTLRALLRDRIETKLPHVKVPTLILRGSQDPIAPEPWTRRAARLIPGARSVSLACGGHCVHFSHPALVARALRKFTFPLRNPTPPAAAPDSR